MPEHVHLLIHPARHHYSISKILSTLKQPVSKRAVLKARRGDLVLAAQMAGSDDGSLRFWMQGGGYDRNVRTRSAFWDHVEYIHNNPVRRGLCETPRDWPWSSARDYHGTGDGPITLDIESIIESIPWKL